MSDLREKIIDALKEFVDENIPAEEAADAVLDALREQEPVRFEFQDRACGWHSFIDNRHYENTVADGSWPIRALYAAPVPPAEFVVPEGWAFVPVELTPEMVEAACYRDCSLREEYAALIAAAPKYKGGE